MLGRSITRARAVFSSTLSSPRLLSTSHHKLKWYIWGGGLDPRSKYSFGIWGRGGLSPKDDPLFSRTPRALAFPDQQFHIKDVAFGVNHYALLSDKGEVYMLGANKKHCLGIKGVQLAKTPTKVEGLPPVKQLALGINHTLALTEEGEVYSWGWGGNTVSGGALGQGKWDDCPTPKPIKLFSEKDMRVKEITTGHHHAVALTESGQVYTWGQGDFGRLGIGGSNSVREPTHVQALKNAQIQKIVAGPMFTAALTTNGQLYTWGRNDAGQLGVSGTAIMSYDIYNMEALPTLVDTLIKEGEKVVEVACGNRHMLALTQKGKLYHWGQHKFLVPSPVMGPKFTGTKVTHVAAGQQLYAATDAFGHVFTWGSPASNALGHAGSDNFLVRMFSTYLNSPKRVEGFGPAQVKEFVNPFGKAIKIRAGFQRIAVLVEKHPEK